MANDATPTRRQVVTATAAVTMGVGAMTALTACSGSGSTTQPGTAMNAGQAQNQAQGQAQNQGAGAMNGGAMSNGTPAGTGHVLAALASLPVGGSITAKGPDGTPLIISRPRATKVVAHSAICTHQGCQVAPAGKRTLDCPCHGAQFDAYTGKVLGGPAPIPLPAVKVKIHGQNIVVA